MTIKALDVYSSLYFISSLTRDDYRYDSDALKDIAAGLRDILLLTPDPYRRDERHGKPVLSFSRYFWTGKEWFIQQGPYIYHEYLAYRCYINAINTYVIEHEYCDWYIRQVAC